MKPPENEIQRLVSEWIRKADLDFQTVVRLCDEESFRDIVAFHAQQAAEKYLKALLTRHQIEFPKTHELRRLLDLLDPVEPGLAESLKDARWLEPFGVEIRYPGDRPDTMPGDELRARELAQRVRSAVAGVLDSYLAGADLPQR
jgi:HEPN domain-containing protein